MATQENFYCHMIAVGVNQTPGAPLLQFAVQDAHDLAELFNGRWGPAATVDVLAGYEATMERFEGALHDAMKSRVDFLIMSFSGHGSQSGLGLHDGEFSYGDLRDWLRSIDASATVVILDNCHAGAFMTRNALVSGMGGLDDTWIRMLRRVVPTTRVLMATGPYHRTVEIDSLRNGVFTHSLVNALSRPQVGDLELDGSRFISDRQAFRAVKERMARYGIRPRGYGLDGHFPLMRSRPPRQRVRRLSGW